jgi:pyruvate dehydrogenase E1 component alpha subunit
MKPDKVSVDISKETLLELYYCMLLSRRCEERLAILYKQGKVLGGIFSGIGQEAVTVGTAFDLKEGDAVFPLHRDIGVCLTRGVEPKVLMAQILGRALGLSHGKTDYLHGGDPALGIYGSTSMIASSFPVAVGVALAFKYRLTNNVAVAYIGDGGTSRGDFHEALNFAGVQLLPIIFIIENNMYAYSTPLERQMAVEDVADRAAGYGMPGHVVSGNDIIAVRHVMAQAVQRARDWLGPSLIECKTYRWHGHSEHDEASYRETEEYLEWKSRDPLPRFEVYLKEKSILTEEIMSQYGEQVEAEVSEAIEAAQKGECPSTDELKKNLFAE